MRAFLTCLIPAVAALSLQASSATAQAKPAKPAPAAEAKTAPPKAIGKFEDWQAATHVEAGQTVCYAFTRVKSSAPALPGRSEVVLTVTQRPALRDAVAITAGFVYAANAAVVVQADAPLDFYTAQRSAFARDGHAAVVAFEKVAKIIAKSPGPRNLVISDTFSTRGFTAAYAAINKACPAK